MNANDFIDEHGRMTPIEPSDNIGLDRIKAMAELLVTTHGRLTDHSTLALIMRGGNSPLNAKMSGIAVCKARLKQAIEDCKELQGIIEDVLKLADAQTQHDDKE